MKTKTHSARRQLPIGLRSYIVLSAIGQKPGSVTFRDIRDYCNMRMTRTDKNLGDALWTFAERGLIVKKPDTNRVMQYQITDAGRIILAEYQARFGPIELIDARDENDLARVQPVAIPVKDRVCVTPAAPIEPVADLIVPDPRPSVIRLGSSYINVGGWVFAECLPQRSIVYLNAMVQEREGAPVVSKRLILEDPHERQQLQAWLDSQVTGNPSTLLESLQQERDAALQLATEAERRAQQAERTIRELESVMSRVKNLMAPTPA